MISWSICKWRPIKSGLKRKNKKNKKTLKKVLTYVFWFGIINKSSRETHKTTTTEYVMERYRSGHNEAVLKTVCPQGRVGSNPTLSASNLIIGNWFGEVPKLAEGTPLERVQVVNSGARVQIPPSPLACEMIMRTFDNGFYDCKK